MTTRYSYVRGAALKEYDTYIASGQHEKQCALLAGSDAFARLKARVALVNPALSKRIATLHLRDMRRSGFVHYAEGDRDKPGRIIRPPVPVHLICSISGHSIEEGMAIIETYLPKTTEQADKAVSMMMGAM